MNSRVGALVVPMIGVNISLVDWWKLPQAWAGVYSCNMETNVDSIVLFSEVDC